MRFVFAQVLVCFDGWLWNLQDMRYLDGAPRAWETVSAVEPSCKDQLESPRSLVQHFFHFRFYEVSVWLVWLSESEISLDISWWFRFFLVYSLVFNFVANPSDWHTDCKEAFPAAFPSRSPSFVLFKKVQDWHSNLFIHTQMIGTV